MATIMTICYDVRTLAKSTVPFTFAAALRHRSSAILPAVDADETPTAARWLLLVPPTEIDARMSLGDSIRSGVRWLAFGNVGGQVLQFAFGVALARLLVPADFGLLVTVQVFTGIAGLFMSGGMGQALVRTQEVRRRDFDAVFTVQFVIGVFTYLAFFVAAPWVAKSFSEPLYAPLLRISALSFVLRPLLNIRNSWLHREMRFRARTVVGLVSALLTGCTSVAMALADMGVFALVLSGFVGSLFTVFALDRITPLRPRLVYDRDAVRRLGSYGAKVTANDLAWYASKQTPNLVISHLAGPAAVGLFNKAESTALLPFSTLSSSVYQPVLRAMAKVQDNTDQTKYLFYRTMTLLMVYTLPLYLGLAWMAEPFLLAIYGEKWLPAAEALRILAVGASLHCITQPAGAVLAAQNRLGREIVVHVTVSLVLLVGCTIGLRWGLVGAAWAWLAALVLSAAWLYRLATACFPTARGELWRAARAPLALNALLLASLAVGHAALPATWRNHHPFAYMFLLAGWGGGVYLLAFLYGPATTLRSEARRWRRHLPCHLKEET